jgi:argininosuccinate synthase
VVLAYSGSAASSAAVKWLVDRDQAGVVAAVVDVGQTDDLEEVRARALACGAVRAHVVDRRDQFAREVVMALGGNTPIDHELLEDVVRRVISAAVVELAGVEETSLVAHASGDAAWGMHWQRGIEVLAPVREWQARGVTIAQHPVAQGVPQNDARGERHLFIRPAVPCAPSDEATVTVEFDAGLPVSINGVTMVLPDLIESVSLIAGQFGVGAASAQPTPAVVVLQAALRAAGDDGTARVRLTSGLMEVAAIDVPQLVTRS